MSDKLSGHSLRLLKRALIILFICTELEPNRFGTKVITVAQAIFAELEPGVFLHRGTNLVQHEPCRHLVNADILGKLIAHLFEKDL